MDKNTKKEMIRRLKKARKIIETGEHWTQIVFAKNSSGQSTSIENGFSFCAIGALEKVTNLIDENIYCDDITRNIVTIMHENSRKLYHNNIVEVNDFIGLDAVLTIFDYTIDQLSNAESNDI